MTPQAAPETSPPGRSEFARLTGVLLDPKPAFADIVSHPRWWVPLILVILMAIVFNAAFTQRVGWDRFMRQTLETSSRAQSMTSEQRERAIEQGARIAVIGAYAGSLLGAPVFALLIAGVLLFVFKTMLGAQLSFNQVFAVSSYALLPGVISTALAILVMFLKSPDDFNLRNPIAFNVGAFLDPQTTPKWLFSLGTSLDLFSIWMVLLLATGISVAARKLSFSKSLAGVVAPWLVLIFLKSAGAQIFS